MTHFFKTLGVSSTEEWKHLAWQRAPLADEKELARRREMAWQLSAMLKIDSLIVDREMLEDEKLYISGRMQEDEYRAYLLEKYYHRRKM